MLLWIGSLETGRQGKDSTKMPHCLDQCGNGTKDKNRHPETSQKIKKLAKIIFCKFRVLTGCVIWSIMDEAFWWRRVEFAAGLGASKRVWRLWLLSHSPTRSAKMCWNKQSTPQLFWMVHLYCWNSCNLFEAIERLTILFVKHVWSSNKKYQYSITLQLLQSG